MIKCAICFSCGEIILITDKICPKCGFDLDEIDKILDQEMELVGKIA